MSNSEEFAVDKTNNDFTEIDPNISGGKEWLKTFQFSKTANKTKCLLCEKEYNGCFVHNLKRHIYSTHKSHAELYNVSIKRKRQLQENDIPKKQKDGKLSRGEYIKNCVLLAVVNMTAFLLFNSPFFRALTLIHATYAKVVINTASIGHFINLTAIEIRKLITLEVKNPLVSIKLDIATRHYRSMLCVNVQFYLHLRKRIAIRTLGCIELNRAHTSSYLEQKVYAILSLYEIDCKNIYSYTSDNGANLLCLGKLIKRMQHDLNLAKEWEQFKEQARDEISDSEESFEDLAPDDDDYDDFEFEYKENMHVEIDDRTTDRLMKSLTINNDDSPLAMLAIFACAAHTVQLAVHDVLGKIGNTNIKRIRSVIKELRSSKYLDYKSAGFKSLKLSVCSRWNSLYMMFASILKHKDDLISFYARVPKKLLDDIMLSSEDFQYMNEFNEAFEPIYKLTLEMQSEQLSMSDVLVHWYRCKRDLSKLNKDKNEFVEHLMEAFDNRTEQLMRNPLLATAAYVDPRLNHKTRSSEFLGEVKETVEKRLLLVLKCIKENKMGPVKPIENDNEAVTSDEDDLEQYMEFEVAKNALQINERPIDDKQLLEQIKRLGCQDKIKMRSNIFGYYEELKKQHLIDDDLFETVMVVLAAPAAQVSVERAFSALAILLDDKRCNLSSDNVDNVLVIALNRQLISLVNFESMTV